MAFDPTPTTWIPSISEDGTNLIIPLASLPELTAAEADAVTGDIRKIAFAINAALRAAWVAQATADRPAQMVLSESNRVDNDTGKITRTFASTFELGVSAIEVEDEV